MIKVYKNSNKYTLVIKGILTVDLTWEQLQQLSEELEIQIIAEQIERNPEYVNGN